MSGDGKIRVGSRKSELALIQTRHVIALLKERNPNKEFEIVTMNTLGDNILDVPLPKIGEKSLFTKELEAALTTGFVDLVVHSLKDLPTVLPEGMVIGAILSREDPRDALVLHKDFNEHTLHTLPEGSTIGTSSLRRAAQLAKNFPHLKVENIRGNLNTRLKKLDELGTYQGIVLATAGLHRMGWHNRISRVIESSELMYAVGQGALAVECRASDKVTIELLKPLYDIQTALQVLAERSFLKTLGGGCSAPVAITTTISHVAGTTHKISVTGAVWSLDGKTEIVDTHECTLQLGRNDKCSVCPYKTATVAQPDTVKSSCTRANCTKTDIECLNECAFKTSPSRVPNKKQKLNDSTETSELSTAAIVDLLKTDPHDQCPVELPVGFDFMGKCPYLESNEITQHDKKKLLAGPSGEDLDITKCPFYKDGKIKVPVKVAVCPVKNGAPDLDAYCGMVPHAELNKCAMDDASSLGAKLAQKLIDRGAAKVITNAQIIIRDS